MTHDVLLLTATILPKPSVYHPSRLDPRKRLDDYLRGLDFYLGALAGGTFASIIFVENSEYDLTELRDLTARHGLSDKVHFVSVAPGPVKQVSLFYLELDLLRKAFRTPEIAGLPDDTVFWKVTGRYVIENVARIVATAPQADVYVNGRNHPTRWTDFYIAAFNRKAFLQVLDARFDDYDNIRTGEEILRESLEDERAAGLTIVPRMKYLPKVSGTRGIDNYSYTGFKANLKYALRAATRRTMPWLWL